MGGHELSLELIGVKTFHVAPVVLEEVRELVVEEDCRFQVGWNIKFDDALLFLEDISNTSISSVVDESICWGCRNGNFGIFRTEMVRVFVRRKICERCCVDGRSRREFFTVGVVKCDLCHKRRAPNEQTANGRKDDANYEESGKDGFGSKNASLQERRRVHALNIT